MSTDLPGTDSTDDRTEQPLRLLIVDDQPLIRRGLAMMLASEAGIEVVGARQGSCRLSHAAFC